MSNVDRLIKEIEENYATGNLGHSLYVRLISLAREMQIESNYN